MAVVLVIFFLMGLIHFWNLSFNMISLVNMVISIGLAVDYSAHIGQTYLTIDAPEGQSRSAKRKYKASQAVSQMGSSVFHGAFSTLLAVCVLFLAKSYIFTIFCKLWMGIIGFGMANGFLFVPVMLSCCGPVGKWKRNNAVTIKRTTASIDEER